MKIITTTFCLIAALCLASCIGGSGEVPEAADASGLPQDTVVHLPLRFHVLQSGERELNAQLSDEAAADMLATVNEIWAIADLKFDLDEVRRPTVTESGEFLAAVNSGEKSPAALAAIASVVPDRELLVPGWNVVVTQSMVNLPPGVYLTAKLTVVIAMETPGGPLHAGTLAHELGHSLSLEHVDGSDSFNLMASGPGTAPAKDRGELSASQIATARELALTGAPASSAAGR